MNSASALDSEARHTIYFGDARHLNATPDASVQLIVTSPPYWQLKDYGSSDQIGFHDSYEGYIAHLNQVWAQCERVLSPGCRLCINIGDQFARAAHYGRYKVIPIRERIVRACEELGLDYMGAIIWQKATTMNASGGGAVMGSFPHPRNGILKIDYEFILLFKKLGAAPKVSPEQKAASAMSPEEWNQFFSGHWNFPGEKQRDGHIAMFPLELPRRLIKMFSFADEVVLDPFAGSGTTIRAAMELGRRGVGYEINQEFRQAMQVRLGLHQPSLYQERVEFKLAPSPNIASEAGELIAPGLERQLDSRQNRFGSVIAASDLAQPKEKGQRVRQVLAPNRLRLEDGAEIILLGVEAVERTREAACKYLSAAVLNKPVFLRFDAQAEASEGAARAYVYLENKTFVNAHLIKRGLARADTSDHRYARKFRDYQAQVAPEVEEADAKEFSTQSYHFI